MTENDDSELKIDKKAWLIWTIIIVILVIWGQIAFLITLMNL